MPPLPPKQAFDLALRFQAAGQLREAEQVFRNIIASNPNLAETYCCLGSVLRQMRRLPEAVVALPYHPDWRWLRERSDSLWYRSAGKRLAVDNDSKTAWGI